MSDHQDSQRELGSRAGDAECNYHHQANSPQDEQQQQVVELLSDEDSSAEPTSSSPSSPSLSSSTASPSPNSSQTNDDGLEHQQQQHQQTKASLESRRKVAMPVASCTTKTSQQHFVRYTVNGGSRRSSRLRRSGRASRQVRFQPIPQAIDISNLTSQSDDSTEGPPSRGSNSQASNLTKLPYAGGMKAAISSSNKSTLRGTYIVGKLKQHNVHLSTKPITRKLHNLSQYTNRIKLKSFNNLAQQFHQSISTSASSNFVPNECSSTPTFKSSKPINTTPPQVIDSHKHDHRESPLSSETSCAEAADDYGWGSDFDEQSVSSSLTSNLPVDTENTSHATCPESHSGDETGSVAGSHHSSSRDSGHSTQHSGCSGGECHHHHGSDLSSSVEGGEHSLVRTPTESVTSSCDNKSDPPLSPTGSVSTNSDQQQPETGVDGGDDRRARFLQNRLIINSKLESMFKSRVPSTEKFPSPKKTESGPLTPQQSSPQHASIQRQTSTPTTTNDMEMPQQKDTVHIQVITPRTRLELLEQQRQMSLKLKQKPRRKTAKRAVNLTNQTGDCVVDKDTDDNRSYASGFSIENDLNRTNSNRLRGRESLTKQLSMICLRQAHGLQQQQHPSSPPQQQQHQLYQYIHSQEHDKPPMSASLAQVDAIGLNRAQTGRSIQFHQQQPKPSMSLRQLVKDVIDDCEKPSKLSTLTRKILNRSDSLSSDLVASADDETANPQAADLPDDQLEKISGELVSSPSLAPTSQRSPSRATSSSDHLMVQQVPNLRSTESSSTIEPLRMQQQQITIEACQPISYMYPIKHSTPQRHDQQQRLTQQVITPTNVSATVTSSNDQSFSSIGTIDGLEWSRGLSESNCELSQLQQQIGGFEKPLASGASTNEVMSGMNTMQRSTISAYLKNLRDLRFKLPKMNKLMGNANGVPANPTLAAATSANTSSSITNLSSQHAVRHQFSVSTPQQNRSQFGTSNGRKIFGSPQRAYNNKTESAHRHLGDDLTNHFVTISNRKWKSCHLRTSLLQVSGFSCAAINTSANGGKGHHFANNHNLSHNSSSSSGGRHLAYLDDSRNFCTDDDA